MLHRYKDNWKTTFKVILLTDVFVKLQHFQLQYSCSVSNVTGVKSKVQSRYYNIVNSAGEKT